MSNPNDIIDEWLVLRCQGGDADALAELVRRWQPRLKGFAIRLLRDESMADDALQATWMDVVRRIHSLRDPRALRSWLFRITANKCADHIRRMKRERSVMAVLAFEDTHEVAEPSSRSDGEPAIDHVRLREAIRCLDDDSQSLLRWHYLEGLSVNEIATRLSKPPGTVKSRLFHTRKKLKQALAGES